MHHLFIYYIYILFIYIYICIYIYIVLYLYKICICKISIFAPFIHIFYIYINIYYLFIFILLLIYILLFTISSVFHSFLKIRISILCISLQSKELPLAFLVVHDCWWWILSFLLSKYIIISLSFLKNIFTGDRILDWLFFL